MLGGDGVVERDLLMETLKPKPAADPIDPHDAARAELLVWWLILAVMTLCCCCLLIAIADASPTRGLKWVFAVLVTAASAYTDLLSRRIFNTLTYPAILAGIAMHLVASAANAGGVPAITEWCRTDGLADGIVGVLAAVAVSIPLYVFRGIGGGDLKLLVAIGAILGFSQGASAAGNLVVASAVIAAANYLTDGRLISKSALLVYSTLGWLATGRIRPDASFSRTQIPLALAAFFGVCLSGWVSSLHTLVAWLERTFPS